MTRRRVMWHRLALATVLAVSALLNVYALGREGYSNAYYAAAVKSMLMSWHNFFFASFDPNGFITVDKPPVGFWLQALSARVFGFHGWALILPQALAGIASVALLYHLVKRIFGVPAALIAAAALALTPIAVAVQRTNQVDGMLVFLMLLSTWCLWKAVESGRLRWLLAAAAVEGVAFNVKMMEAYLILPALYVFFWVASRGNWRRKLGLLAAFTAVLAVVSFSWATIVDLTPATQRPYVGSTKTNSEMELIFGYNGIQRLTGHIFGGAHPDAPLRGAGGTVRGAGGGFPQARSAGADNATPGGGAAAAASPGSPSPGTERPFATRRQGGGFPGGAGGAFGTGGAGPLRLFQGELGGQISWLLPFALLAAVPLLRRVRRGRALDRQEQAVIFWLAWLLPMVGFFSIAGFFHSYYLVTLAPAIAALAGAGLVQGWHDWTGKGRGWRWFVPGALLADLAFEAGIVASYPQIRAALIGAAIAAAVAGFALAARARRTPWRAFGAACLVLAFLVAPGYWSLTPMLVGVNGSMPAAGPAVRRAVAPGGPRAFGGTGGFGTRGDVSASLLAYLEARYPKSPGSYLLATSNAMTAAPVIIQTGLPVMAMGGFLGSDPALSVSKLQQLTAAGKLRYILLGGFGRAQTAAAQWITQHCAVVPASAWGGSTTAARTDRDRANPFMYQGGQHLYDCASASG